MSVLIKGMEMPMGCDNCMFSRRDITNTDWCVLTEKNLPCDCPLIEVPTPHGDLIDRETAKKTVRRALEVNCKNLMNTAVPMLIDYALNNAPTIIESEGE